MCEGVCVCVFMFVYLLESVVVYVCWPINNVSKEMKRNQ